MGQNAEDGVGGIFVGSIMNGLVSQLYQLLQVVMTRDCHVIVSFLSSVVYTLT